MFFQIIFNSIAQYWQFIYKCSAILKCRFKFAATCYRQRSLAKHPPIDFLHFVQQQIAASITRRLFFQEDIEKLC